MTWPTKRQQARTGLTIATWIVIAIVFVVAVGTVGLVWRYFIAEPRGIVEQEELIQQGAHRFAAYGRFFDLCASIQAKEGMIDAQLARKQTDRVEANIAALQGRRISDIQQYNADARNYQEGQFRDASLPFQLPAQTYTGSNPTRCGQ